MKGRGEEEVLKELMDDMNGMDRERLGKKRGGPSITIAIGMPKPEEKEMEEKCEACGGVGCPACESKESETEMPGMGMPGMESEEDEPDDEEDMLIEEATALGIPDPESMDIRLLKKLVERKKSKV